MPHTFFSIPPIRLGGTKNTFRSLTEQVDRPGGDAGTQLADRLRAEWVHLPAFEGGNGEVYPDFDPGIEIFFRTTRDLREGPFTYLEEL